MTHLQRNLSGEISKEFVQRQTDEKPVDDLMRLVDEIIPFDMQHNAEHGIIGANLPHDF